MNSGGYARGESTQITKTRCADRQIRGQKKLMKFARIKKRKREKEREGEKRSEKRELMAKLEEAKKGSGRSGELVENVLA